MTGEQLAGEKKDDTIRSIVVLAECLQDQTVSVRILRWLRRQ